MAPDSSPDEPLLAVSVNGPVGADALGVVLPAEHVLASLHGLCSSPADAERAAAPFELRTLGAIRRNPTGYLANLDLRAEDEARDELSTAVRELGGAALTLVDCTPASCGRDARALRRLAAASGATLVMSAGFGSEAMGHEGWLEAASDEEIAQRLIEELQDGVDLGPAEPRARAGVLCAAVSGGSAVDEASPGLRAREAKLVSAVGIACRRTLAPVFVHMPRFEPFEPAHALCALDLLERAGAPLARCVLVLGGPALLRLAARAPELDALVARGASVCVVGAGMPDVWAPSLARAPRLPTDVELADVVLSLCARAAVARVLVSAGVCTRLQRVAGGGYGYAHAPTAFAALLEARGLARGDVRAVCGGNAARLLAWWRPLPPPPRAVRQWTCYWCGAEHEEALHPHDRLPTDHEYFEKFSWRYCSRACLAQHREAGFAARAAVS